MDLLNCSVIHNKKFGKGVVVAQEGEIIFVKFSVNEIRFVVPDAFVSFLRCEDEALQQALEEEFNKKVEEKEKRLETEQEEKRKKEEERARLAIQETNRVRVVKGDRHAHENNLAFKCNYCDGGCSSHCVGYKGVCSDEQITYNIEKKKRAWCCDKEGSYCYKYYNGDITREQLEEHHKTIPVCYESKMLIEWRADAGQDRNGIRGAKTRRISNASNNSLAILTTELPSEEGGKERVIFGVFITGEVDEGDDIQEGYVKALGGYHVELTPSESKQMKFWHYYKNPNKKDSVQWGMGLYRYVKDTTCARILLDILNIKTDIAEKEKIQEMLEYYCRVKNIDVNNIPSADGAI